MMTAFEHVTALFSFVYALALTHLLARIAELIVARDRVRFSGLLALGMINAILVVFANWLSLWDLHAITSWNLASISVQFLFAINVFLICVLVGPKAHDDGPIDLEDFFWRQRPYFYGALVACAVLSLFANLDYSRGWRTMTKRRRPRERHRNMGAGARRNLQDQSARHRELWVRLIRKSERR